MYWAEFEAAIQSKIVHFDPHDHVSDKLGTVGLETATDCFVSAFGGWFEKSIDRNYRHLQMKCSLTLTTFIVKGTHLSCHKALNQSVPL
jgi:hypothetical protein